MPFKGVFEDNGKIVSYLDELRYYVMSLPEPPKREEQSALIACDKLRRIKKLRRR